MKIKVIFFRFIFAFFHLLMRASFPAAAFLKAFFHSPKTGAGLENKQATQKVNFKDAHTPLLKPEVDSVSLVWK